MHRADHRLSRTVFGRNIVGAGSDGTTYWSLFNVEGETTLNAQFATYGALTDMLNDENRTGVFTPDGSGIFGRNIVGSGAFAASRTLLPIPLPASGFLLIAALAGLGLTYQRSRGRRSAHRAI